MICAQNSKQEKSTGAQNESSEDEDTKNKTKKAAKRKLKKQKKKESRKSRKKSKKKKDKLKEALRKEEKNAKEADQLLKMDERKRPYYSMHEAKKPTSEEIEAYQMKRKRDGDPMAQFL